MKRMFFIATILLLLAACDRRDLTYDYDPRIGLEVIFDWQKSPTARPENMSLYLFPKDNSEVWRYDFSDKEGGTIRIPEGTYNLLCFNSDSEVAMFRYTDCWETFEVSTHDASAMQFLTKTSSGSLFPRAEGTEKERMVYSVDSLWRNGLNDFTVLRDEGDTLVTLMPKSAVRIYRVEIQNVMNVQYVSKLSATVSSMAGGVRVADGSLSDEIVTISFGMNSNTVENSIVGAFATFGHCAHVNSTHQLVLYVIMQDGSKLYYTFDITQKLHEADEADSELIVIDGFSLPGPVGGDGFNAEADEWETVDIDIKM